MDRNLPIEILIGKSFIIFKTLDVFINYFKNITKICHGFPWYSVLIGNRMTLLYNIPLV